MVYPQFTVSMAAVAHVSQEGNHVKSFIKCAHSRTRGAPCKDYWFITRFMELQQQSPARNPVPHGFAVGNYTMFPRLCDAIKRGALASRYAPKHVNNATRKHGHH